MTIHVYSTHTVDVKYCVDIRKQFLFFVFLFPGTEVIASEQLDGLDLEVKSNEREHHALEILNQVIKTSQAIWIPET